MNTKEPKKKSTKTAAGTKKSKAKIISAGKAARTSAVKTKNIIAKSPIKTAQKTTKTEKKNLSFKAVAGKTKKKAEIKPKENQKIKVDAGAVATKKPAAKPKPAKKTEKKGLTRKAVPLKTEVKPGRKIEVKPKARVIAEIKTKTKAKISKVSAVRPDAATKTEKQITKKKSTAVKAKVAIRPKADVKDEAKAKPAGKITAVKRKPAEKKEVTAITKKKGTAKAEGKLKPKAEAKTQDENKVVVKEVSITKSLPDQKTVKAAKTSPTEAVSITKKTMAPKAELTVPAKPTLESVAAPKRHDTKDESKANAKQSSLKSATSRLKIFLPDQDVTNEEAEEFFFGGLPEEYGENSVIALVVDPNTVFVDWEVIPNEISDKEGDLNLRFYDITGIESNDWNVHAVIDVQINKRVGNGFFDIRLPGRDVVVAVGISNAVSGFMPIAWSDMISFPRLLTFDELGIIQKLFESGIPLGY